MTEAKSVLKLNDEQMALVTALGEARAQKKQWEEQEQRCRAALLSEIDDADTLFYNDRYVAQIENRESTRFDRKTFAKDWPKLDETYRTETKSKVINIVGTNEGA